MIYVVYVCTSQLHRATCWRRICIIIVQNTIVQQLPNTYIHVIVSDGSVAYYYAIDHEYNFVVTHRQTDRQTARQTNTQTNYIAQS